jgi:glucose-1-phosphate adenylyltransferase
MSNISAMILAGGRGTRMDIFCYQRPKPVLPFAGKYRVIDFTLGNCVNSGITDIAVLLDYQRQVMADYLTTWRVEKGLTRNLKILPPGSTNYKGTADAVYQNLANLDDNTDRVLILAGDHVYNMDYRKMLAFHDSVKADVTVGVVRVPLDQAHRFGTVSIDSQSRIKEFVEKSSTPQSNIASMGIYIFNKDLLYPRLTADSLQPDSIHDFGYSILPDLVNHNRVFAYEFDSYWQDIGTVEAYYQANMELLSPSSSLALGEKIVVENSPAPTSDKGGGRVINSIVSPGCVVKGYVENSVLSPGVFIDEQAEVINSVVMDNTYIGFHSIVDTCMLDEGVLIGKFCHLGFGLSSAAGIGEITTLGKGVIVPSETAIGRKCKIHPGLGREAFGSRFVASGTVVSAGV